MYRALWIAIFSCGIDLVWHPASRPAHLAVGGTARHHRRCSVGLYLEQLPPDNAGLRADTGSLRYPDRRWPLHIRRGAAS